MLTQEEAARLRIKARHGELTPEEQLMYSEYMEQSGNAQQGQAGPVTPPPTVQGVQPVPAQAAPNPQDTGSFGWAVLGFFVPLVGLILYLVWKNEKPLTARRAGKGALISVIVSVVLMVIWMILMFVLVGSMAGGAMSSYSYYYDTVLFL